MQASSFPVASTSPQELLDGTSTVLALISRYSASYGVSEADLKATLTCESHLKPDAIGDQGTSFGIAQIHLPAHPNISKAQALDPAFAIRWTAQQFAQGHQAMWTCWREAHE